MKKYITEFIGTFFLVLVVGLNSNAGGANLIAIGSVLMVMIYAGGHISGGHYNPAVTLGVLIRGRISMGDAIPYWVAQAAGGVAAALISAKVMGMEGSGASAIGADSNITRALVAEILGTFALVYVVLNVATAKANTGNSYFGLAIGFTVLACGYVLGKYSGGAFNPAVAVGQCVNGGFAWSDIWIYLVGCFGGAILAAIVFKMNNADDK
jgi:aquaporin Z